MVEAGRFVDGLKAASVKIFVGVPVALLYGYYCTDRPFSSPTVGEKKLKASWSLRVLRKK